MYRLMNDHRDDVIGELTRISDVPRYLELRRKMREVDVGTDVEFQQMYRDYWRMSLSRLGSLFYKRYFVHMEELKASDAGRNEAAIREIAMLSDTPERSRCSSPSRRSCSIRSTRASPYTTRTSRRAISTFPRRAIDRSRRGSTHCSSSTSSFVESMRASSPTDCCVLPSTSFASGSALIPTCATNASSTC